MFVSDNVQFLLKMEPCLHTSVSLKSLEGVRVETREKDALSTWNLLTDFFDIKELRFPHKSDGGKPNVVPSPFLRLILF